MSDLNTTTLTADATINDPNSTASATDVVTNDLNSTAPAIESITNDLNSINLAIDAVKNDPNTTAPTTDAITNDLNPARPATNAVTNNLNSTASAAEAVTNDPTSTAPPTNTATSDLDSTAPAADAITNELNATAPPTGATTDTNVPWNVLINNIQKIMAELSPQDPYFLVGGSSLILHGSSRVTEDVDILVQRSSVVPLESSKASFLEKCGSGKIVTLIKEVDILTEIASGRFDFETIAPLLLGNQVKGVNIAPLDVLLGSKIHAYYLRPDGEQGDKKRASDLQDLRWICRQLEERGERVRKEVSDKLYCGPYNMLFVVIGLYSDEQMGADIVKLFEKVGGRDFECEWERSLKEFEDQVEYYEMTIEDEWEENEVELLQSRRKT